MNHEGAMHTGRGSERRSPEKQGGNSGSLRMLGTGVFLGEMHLTLGAGYT
jgi:hypothetical protein